MFLWKIENKILQFSSSTTPNLTTDLYFKQIVTTLTPESFHTAVTKDHLFVEFGTPWCEHCQIMAPRLEELAEGLRNDKTVRIAKVRVIALYGASIVRLWPLD